MHNNYMCFTNFPNINELLLLFATIQTPEKVNTSYYNVVIKKCRQLIFENGEVLASPNHDGMYGIYIVVKDSFYESGELQKYLSNHNLKSGPPTVVPKYIYEDCCMYTIIAKLAPKWNLVSNYFVRGRDFLLNTSPKDCVRFSICINDKGETTMIFEISRIKLPSMTIDKLDLPSYTMKELNEKNTVAFIQCNSKTIRVLPSLKRGNILSISLKINEYWSLQNYQQFRRHWKNTYGYRLPETDDNIFYLEVSFFDGSPIFTYPSVCVRPFEPTFVQRVEPVSVVTGFIADLMRYMPNVLGDSYPVPSHVSQPNPSLFPGTENVVHSNVCPIDVNNISDTQNSAFVYLPTQKVNSNVDDSKSKLSQLLSQLKKPENKAPIYLTQKTSFTPGISQTPRSVLEDKLDENKTVDENNAPDLNKPKDAQFLTKKLAEPSNMTPKIVPKFTKSVKPTVPLEQKTNKNKTTEKYAPIFTSKFPKIKTIKNIPESAVKPAQKEVKPVQKQFKPVQKEVKPVQKEVKPAQKEFKPVQKEVKPVQKEVNPIQKEVKPIQKVIKPIRPDTAEDDLADFDLPIKNKSPVIPAIFKLNKILNKSKETENKIESLKPQNINTEKKRIQFENSLESPVAKKPRNKSAVTEVNNMKELVNNGTINKLNNQSLLKWLKDKNIHCTTKDKKSVLIEKVISNLSKE